MYKLASTLIFILISLLLFTNCNKKETPDEGHFLPISTDYIGEWYTQARYEGSHTYQKITIDSLLEGRYDNVDIVSNVIVLGETGIDHTIFKIGLKKFALNQAPQRLGNVGNFWKMTLDGSAYYCDKDLPTGQFYTCTPMSFCVKNIGQDIIHALMGNDSMDIYPGNLRCSKDTTFETEIIFTDDKGHVLSFFNTGCPNIVEID